MGLTKDNYGNYCKLGGLKCEKKPKGGRNVARPRFELGTQGFSVLCSTN